MIEGGSEQAVGSGSALSARLGAILMSLALVLAGAAWAGCGSDSNDNSAAQEGESIGTSEAAQGESVGQSEAQQGESVGQSEAQQGQSIGKSEAQQGEAIGKSYENKYAK